MTPIDRVQALIPLLINLSVDQFAWIERLVGAMTAPVSSRRDPGSDVLPDDRALGLFALHLLTHHTLSPEPFKKEKFEYAVEKVMAALGRGTSRPLSRTNPGLDLTVDGSRWSFKSEAHREIKPDLIHISKWMELGRGEWGSEEAALQGLCDRFLQHLGGYDRIFLLRCLTPDDPVDHHYEMLEIPKSILTVAKSGSFTMMHESQQNPKPGYCRVSDSQGQMYELYFDGGTERKLRLQKLRRDLCVFHAEWRFRTPGPQRSPSTGEQP